MDDGPAGAFGFVNGCVAIHASNATRYGGEKRRSAIRWSCSLPRRRAVNQALNLDASVARAVCDSVKARLASVRVAEALASLSEDSVPHFAAEYPAQAAVRATMESSTASVIGINRARRSASPCSLPCLACSPIS